MNKAAKLLIGSFIVMVIGLTGCTTSGPPAEHPSDQASGPAEKPAEKPADELDADNRSAGSPEGRLSIIVSSRQFAEPAAVPAYFRYRTIFDLLTAAGIGRDLDPQQALAAIRDLFDSLPRNVTEPTVLGRIRFPGFFDEGSDFEAHTVARPLTRVPPAKSHLAYDIVIFSNAREKDGAIDRRAPLPSAPRQDRFLRQYFVHQTGAIVPHYVEMANLETADHLFQTSDDQVLRMTLTDLLIRDGIVGNEQQRLDFLRGIRDNDAYPPLYRALAGQKIILISLINDPVHVTEADLSYTAELSDQEAPVNDQFFSPPLLRMLVTLIQEAARAE